MIKLREYQSGTVDGIRKSFSSGKRKVVMCAPTGAGKTAMFSYMVSQAIKKGSNALVVTDRIELLKQAGGSFDRFGIHPQYISAGSYPNLNAPVHVAMVETLARRADKYSEFLSTRRLVIFDESHKSAFDKIFPYLGEDTFVIGATATPFRKGKSQKGMDEFYDDIVQSVDTPELIELGFLSKPNYFGVDVDMTDVKKTAGEFDSRSMQKQYEKLKTFKGVIDNYVRLTPGKKAIVFSAGIENSKQLAEEMDKRGIPAMHLDSNMSKADRDAVLNWFNVTHNGVLLNVGIATTGFDQPDIEVVILYRATTSLPLYLQMVGRGSRVTDSKSEFTVLDFGNNVKRFGFWDDPREWSLDKVGSSSEGVAPVKTCPECEALVAASIQICGFCGHVFPKQEEESVPEVVLTEIKSKVPDRLLGKMVGDLNVLELSDLQDSGAYKPSFIWRVVRSKGREELAQYAKMRGYSMGWVYRQEREMGNSSFSNYRLR
jgi:superfamily II DNA or RNA helicase